jgi:hypothetical protein
LKIIVLDKFLNNEECDVIGSFIEGSEFTKTERDSAQTDHIRQWVLEKLPKEYIKYF